jgi:hypothetical protein
MKGLILGAVIAVALTGGVAYATIPDGSGVLHACYKQENGQLRLVQAATDCNPSESAITWNQQGPKGDTGNTGPQGPKGDTGAAGPQGASGPSDAYAGTAGPTALSSSAYSTLVLVPVPAGRYVVQATVNTSSDTFPSDDLVYCLLTYSTSQSAAGNQLDAALVQVFTAAPLMGTFSSTVPTYVAMRCTDASGAPNNVSYADAHVVATAVGALH